jgi:predicted amidohydrolase YtcJ
MQRSTSFGTLIVAGAACLCAPIASAQDNPPPADLIISNAQVVTVGAGFPIAQAIAVSGERIVAVGKNSEMSLFKGPLTRVLDAEGMMVLPGLYDSQVQSYKAALSEFAGPLPVLTSIAEAQDYLRDQDAKLPAGVWIVLDRVYPTRMKEDRLPTLKELDAAATNHPVYWNCGPIAMVNSKALEVSRITKETQSPLGGELGKDLKTSKPTGFLRNASQLLKITNAPPRLPTPVQQRELLKRLYQFYNEQGITSIGERQSEPEAIDRFRELSNDKQLTVRINCTRVLDLAPNLDDTIVRLDALTNAPKDKLAYGPTGTGDDWVHIGALKVFLDGELGNATAYLRAPWGIGPTYHITLPAYRGSLRADADILSGICVEAAQRGWQLTGHCVGDAAIDSILNAYQRTQFQTNITERRFLISEADFQATQHWEKCRRLGVGATVQPIWLYRDGFSLAKTLGATRMKEFLPLKTWFEHGLVVGGGSDHVAKLDSHASMNPWNPWLGMWITLTRETDQGTVLNPEECLTREQAIRLYTLNNAYLNFEDNKKGSLEVGKLADLVVIDRDILKCPVNDVLDTKVLLTMVGGKVVWLARPASELTQVPGSSTVSAAVATAELLQPAAPSPK